jgi:molybdopterin molybdotransferase
MLTIDEAQRIVLESVSPLPAERMPLLQALGCVLAEPVMAQIPLPPFDNSAMDGYAVIAADTRGAAPSSPHVLKVIEDLPAGTAPALHVHTGTAARIMTGAPVPAGADAVVMVEDTRPGADGTVEIMREAEGGDNIRPAGEDIARGQVALSAGHMLGSGELGLAAALGCSHVAAVRRPRAAIVTTGSELIEPGQELVPGAIYNSNQVTLASRVLSAGAEVARCLHAADEPAAVEEALRQCADADIILTTGGVSVGDYDFVKVALERLGEIKFWKVLMKPGKPVAFGDVLGRPLFGLPGNPVSALVTFELLVVPALRKMAGRKDCLPVTVQARLLADLPHKPPRREYVQAFTEHTAAGYTVLPSKKRGSAMLTSTVGANSLMVIPEESKGLRAGEMADVILLAGVGAAV